MQEMLETAEQTASSSSRVLQQTTIGSHGRRPAIPNRSTNVSCQCYPFKTSTTTFDCVLQIAYRFKCLTKTAF